jgi:hypothetical protein
MFTAWRSLTDRFGVDLFCRLFLETTSYEKRFSKLGAQFTFSQRRHGTKSQRKLQDCLCHVHVVLVTYRSSSAPATLKAIVWNSSTAAFYIRMGSAGRRTVSCDNFCRANDSIFVGGES